eukprot:gene13992-18764_t
MSYLPATTRDGQFITFFNKNSYIPSSVQYRLLKQLAENNIFAFDAPNYEIIKEYEWDSANIIFTDEFKTVEIKELEHYAPANILMKWTKLFAIQFEEYQRRLKSARLEKIQAQAHNDSNFQNEKISKDSSDWLIYAEQNSCALCQDLLATPFLLGCTHSFCGSCLDNFLEAVKLNTEGLLACPTCKSNIESCTYQRNYDEQIFEKVNSLADCDEKCDWFARRTDPNESDSNELDSVLPANLVDEQFPIEYDDKFDWFARRTDPNEPNSYDFDGLIENLADEKFRSLIISVVINVFMLIFAGRSISE